MIKNTFDRIILMTKLVTQNLKLALELITVHICTLYMYGQTVHTDVSGTHTPSAAIATYLQVSDSSIQLKASSGVQHSPVVECHCLPRLETMTELTVKGSKSRKLMYM